MLLAGENRGNDQHVSADCRGGKYQPFKRLHDLVSFLFISHCSDTRMPTKLVRIGNRKDCDDSCSFCNCPSKILLRGRNPRRVQ